MFQAPKADQPKITLFYGSSEINHPDHYTAGGVEVWDYIKAKLTREELIGYLKGNILKYVSRASYKGQAAKDCGKLAWYARRLEEIECGVGDGTK